MGPRRHHALLPGLYRLATAVASLAALSGCQSGGNGSDVGGRPMVEVSAADLFSWGPGSSSQQLEFYDELERRPVVSQDDAVHAVLLLGGGTSAPTYQARIDAAKSRGLLDPGYSHPAREAVTIGEVAQMVVRSLRLPGGRSPDEATASLKREGLIPEHAREYQGLTGSQMLAMLSAASELRATARGPESELPAAKPEPAAVHEAEAAAKPPAPDRTAAPPVAAAVEAQPAASLSGAPRAMSEPLPELAPRRPVTRRPMNDARLLDLLAAPAPPPMPSEPIRPRQEDGPPQTTDRPAQTPAEAHPSEPAPTRPGVPQPGRWAPAKPLRKPVRPTNEP